MDGYTCRLLLRGIRLPIAAAMRRHGKRGSTVMKDRINKRGVLLAILCVLVMAFAVPAASAASYSKVYGQTQTRVRVRESASTNATIIDNVVKDACVYITTSKTSGGNTFVQVKYRASNGDIETGWICQSDGSETYIKVLSSSQAKSTFNVSGGDLPSKRVGTFTEAERKASAADSDNTYLREGSNGESVKDVQTKLKALGYYYGDITGNVGTKTEAAIKEFQRRNGLTADGIAGPQTIAKIDAVYSASGASVSSSSSSSSGSSLLRLNSSGTKVRDLQQDLTTLGYYWAEITGNFGPKTEAAVKEFQRKNGLTADGIAGPDTLNAIAAQVERNGGSSSSSSSSSSGTYIKLNSQGTKVSQLQEDLKALGYYYAEITGNVGSKTEAAIKEFQRDHGLTADGVAGPRTLDAIEAALGGSSSSSSGSSSGGLRLGSTGTDVSNLQTDLTTLGYYYGDITGHFGSMTQAAVKKFQKSRGLTQDGIAGTTTLNAIASALKNSGSSSAGGSSTSNTLREGDSGTAVTELQTMLKSLDYYYGDITGHFGSLTRRAVRAFQDDNDLTVDGIAGPATLNKLRSLTGGSSTDSSGSGTTVKTENSYGRITKNNVNLRSSYSTTSSAKASLAQGTLVRISKTYTVSGVRWYYITVTIGRYTHQGYVRSDMMETITEAEYNQGGGDSSTGAGDIETIGMIRVTGNNVSLRYEPSTSAERVSSANKGDVFYYVDTVDGWFQTKSGYWISRDYAEVMSDDEAADYIGSGGEDSGSVYKYDSTGSMVTYIQEALTELGYYTASITGHFGGKTEDAVKAFQRDHGLTADGVVGSKTLSALTAAYTGTSDATTDYKAVVYNIDWQQHKADVYNAQGVAKGRNAKLTDLRTGKSLNIYIQSTGQHADVEPLTAADTTTLCSIFGVGAPSQISYFRRPMLLTTSNGTQFVCSIYGQPHGADTISNNNFSGQFCLHFLNSRTHGTDRVDEDHQNAIKDAVTIMQSKTVTVDGVETKITVKTQYP